MEFFELHFVSRSILRLELLDLLEFLVLFVLNEPLSKLGGSLQIHLVAHMLRQLFILQDLVCLSFELVPQIFHLSALLSYRLLQACVRPQLVLRPGHVMHDVHLLGQNRSVGCISLRSFDTSSLSIKDFLFLYF